MVNLLLAVWAVLSVPFRLLGRPARPKWIRFRLEGSLPWRARGGRRSFRKRGGADRPKSIEALRQRLQVFAADPAVDGVLLELHDFELTPAKRDALVALLRTFRERGKQVVAHAVTLSNSAYALACHANRVLLSPAGRLDLTGFAAEATSIGEGLRKLGIAPHFVRRGEYKTAPELFTRDSLSPIQRETVERLLDERYADLISNIARGRGMSEDEARARIDRGPFSARRAMSEGLVDEVVSEAEVPQVLQRLSGANTGATIGASTGATGTTATANRKPDAVTKDASQADADEDEERTINQLVGNDVTYRRSFVWPQVEWRRFRRPPVVAVIPVSGTIVPGPGGSTPFGPSLCGADGVVKQLRSMTKNPRVKAIVLHIDSPGGSAIASEVMLEAIERADRKKPVIAYCERVAASGGYMAAIGARELWASPHALMGSIGVFAGKFDASELMARFGVTREVLTRGNNAGIFSASRPFTDSERAALEADVEETYQTFLAHVARSRELTVAEVHARGEGRVFSGQRALEQGLVDTIGGFEEACRRALELARAPVPDVFAVSYPEGARGWLSMLRLLRQASAPTVYAWAWPLIAIREV